MATYYEILQVNEKASPEVITASYKALLKKYHPDNNLAFQKEANEMISALNQAYDVLSNPLKRLDYDSFLVTQRYANTSQAPMKKETTETKSKKEVPNSNNEPSPSAPSKLMLWSPIFIAILCLIVFIAIQKCNKELESSQQMGTVIQETTPKETSAHLQEYLTPSHGYILRDHEVFIPGDNQTAPLRIEFSPSSYKYYVIKLTNCWDKNKYFTFFARGSEQFIEMDVNCGDYYITYAAGNVWYGSNDLFGTDTKYFRCDDVFEFYHDDDTICGNTLTLYPVVDGNMDTEEISADEF